MPGTMIDAAGRNLAATRRPFEPLALSLMRGTSDWHTDKKRAAMEVSHDVDFHYSFFECGYRYFSDPSVLRSLFLKKMTRFLSILHRIAQRSGVASD
jgi:hypothetical protein